MNYLPNLFLYFAKIELGVTREAELSRSQACVSFFENLCFKKHSQLLLQIPNLQDFEVPCITDNCYTMVKASRASKLLKKFFCMGLAKIDEDIHKIPKIKALDKKK